MRRLTQGEVQETLRDVFSLDASWNVKLSPDPASSLGFTNDSSVLVVGGNTARELLKTAEDAAGLVVEQLATLLPCSQTAADRACVEEFINQYGLRLFRRPVAADELARYADFQASVATRSDFGEGMKWMITSMIQSPLAIYRSEIGTQDASGNYVLGEYELASELSYLITGTAPDSELLQAAERNSLSEPVARRAQAERLLGTSSGHEGMRTFFSEWLRYRRVLGQSREDDPAFATEVSPEMVEETRAFLDAVVFDKNGTVHDLMMADFTMLSPTLSQFYGYGGVSASGYQEVSRPEEYGMGLLAQGSLLAATAHQGATSPTLRGLLVSEHFLCMEPPAPPAVVPTIESTQVEPVNTTREKYELNHAAGGASCKNCHLAFEPFGYAFEHFDETGRYRADENGFAINTAVDNALLPDGSYATLSGLDDVSRLVESGTAIQDCFSGLMAAYMFAGASGKNCLAEEARAEVAAGSMSIRDYLLALTEAPHFTTRQP